MGFSGEILLMAYFILSVVVMMNLLIAMLSDTFSRINERVNDEYQMQKATYIVHCELAPVVCTSPWMLSQRRKYWRRSRGQTSIAGDSAEEKLDAEKNVLLRRSIHRLESKMMRSFEQLSAKLAQTSRSVKSPDATLAVLQTLEA